MLDLLNEQYGNTNIISYLGVKKTTLRVNILKTTIEYVKDELDKNLILYEQVSWYKEALIILNAKEDKIKSLDIYKDGLIYLQNLSSMLPALVLEPKDGERILDMTAAPGGKTTQLKTLADCYITAIEKNKIRNDRLKYNIEKQGAKKVTVLCQDARELDDFFIFDKILLDAPCSGSGTLTSISEFNEKVLKECIKVQFELLEKAFKLLKKGGTLVYSTCSILSVENELQIEKLMKKYNLKIETISISSDIPKLKTSLDGTLCVHPTEVYQGFFVAKIIKL